MPTASAALQTDFGTFLLAERDFPAARACFLAALALHPAYQPALRGLGRALLALGNPQAADAAFRAGFVDNACVTLPYRGPGAGIPLLLLVTVQDANIVSAPLIDDTIFAVTAMHVDYADPARPLPPHAILVNAIADADLCAPQLRRAIQIVARSQAPVLNHPHRVLGTGRAAIAAALRPIAGVIAPEIAALTREALPSLSWPTPYLLRAAGFHTGQNFVRVDSGNAAAAAAALPGDNFLALRFLGAPGPDGYFRKYRVMAIGGEILPLHLVHSRHWKVHGFSAEPPLPAHAQAERAFLENMAAALGPRACPALRHIVRTLALDYAGIDFALGPDGAVLVFEANAAMALCPPPPDEVFAPRRHAVARATEAARLLLRTSAGIPPPSHQHATWRAAA